MSDAILVLNAGSSSLKFTLFSIQRDSSLVPELRGQIEGIGTAPHFKAKDENGKVVGNEELSKTEHATQTACLSFFGKWLRGQLGDLQVKAVGHRVVHGGMDFAAPVMVSEEVLEKLDALVPLAPLHQPHNVGAIRAVARALPDMPQVACFDTSFHRSQPQLAQAFALPKSITSRGVRRYGFHGLSYEYIASAMPRYDANAAAGRVVVCHLGNGSSMCAVANGKSVASTMGFTAVDGLPMGTRCGNLDPGVLLYLMDEMNMDARAIENLIYKQSGLLGVSGVSSDMRTLQASSDAGREARRRSLHLPHRPRARLTGRGAGRARRASSSPPASARTAGRCAAASCAMPRGSAWSWTTQRTRRRGPASAPRRAACPRG